MALTKASAPAKSRRRTTFTSWPPCRSQSRLRAASAASTSASLSTSGTPNPCEGTGQPSRVGHLLRAYRLVELRAREVPEPNRRLAQGDAFAMRLLRHLGRPVVADEGVEGGHQHEGILQV